MKNSNTKKYTYILKTDHFEAHLITEETVSVSSMQGNVGFLPMVDFPTVYLMIGPVGGPLARVEKQDAEILAVLLNQVLHSGSRYIPGTAPT